ncbi:MAG TPA: ribonuclease Y [Candidatus Mediterraneibacter surreyensis]|nr:ribonuclease Y [Candidatus Mediterraneibacter surreyensis]
MQLSLGLCIVIAVALALIVGVISHFATVSSLRKNAESKIGNAEAKAREIIDDAVKTAETKKKEALLEVKEESIKTKNDLEKETKERRAELQRYEKRVLAKEEAVEKRSDALEHRESKLSSKEEQLRQRETRVEELSQKRVQELERISGLTSEQAKEYLLKTVEEDVKHDTAKMVRELEAQAKEEADKKAKEYVVNAIQRCAADHVAETTISVVQLPSDEMKGRIIGREGRNIRTLETLTGVELIIDDTPEAVVLSGFDPIRREVARIALERLIVDGRIHPARIEEMVEKAQKEVDTMIREEGEAAMLEVGVTGIHPELVRLLGRMKFRTSYGQNALKHSIEVAQLAGLLAGEIGIDVRMAKRAGLLHDIGKSIDHDVEGSHIQIGVDLCRKYKESATVINAVEAHHGDVEPQTLVACVVQAADTISAARPGARRETIETYTNRLKQLEDITNQFKGVEKSFAIQAGREIRVMVVPEQVSDDDMVLLARDIAKQIEFELEYPGQIKVNVIRESRATDYAK